VWSGHGEKARAERTGIAKFSPTREATGSYSETKEKGVKEDETTSSFQDAGKMKRNP